VGETVNIMSIDTQRFVDLAPSLNSLWQSPLVILLSMISLWNLLGPSCLAGLAVMLLLIPTTSITSTFMRKFQFANMRTKDKRIKVMNEILEGIRVLKLYAWEPSFLDKISNIRADEVKTLMKVSYLGGVQTFMFSTAPTMVALASFATYVLSDPNNILDAQKAFVSLSFFNIMRQPLTQLPNVITQLIQVQVSLQRVNDFMNSTEVNPTAITRNNNTEYAITVDNASFKWDSDEEAVAIKDVSLSVRKGELVAVMGTVGCGKSSLLAALTGDMDKMDGSGQVNVDGSIAYVPQEAWIQNATLQYNITFGTEYRDKAYNKIIDACAMRPDLKILKDGDMTEIGEKGINLSGGQKHRTSLARAIYSNSDIYLMDDPLSAVDAHVGKHIFENVISTKTGLLKNKTRLLVTNAVGYLTHVDKIVVIKEGRITEQGTYKELMRKGGEFTKYLLEHVQENAERRRSSVFGDSENELEELKIELETVLGRRTSLESSGGGKGTEGRLMKSISRMNDDIASQNSAKMSSTDPAVKKPPTGRGGKQRGGGGGGKGAQGLMVKEKVETKEVKWSIYISYAKAVGLLTASIIFASAFLTQVFNVMTNFWLAAWSDDPNSAEPKVRDTYLGVYGALGAATAITIVSNSLITALGGLNASSRLHNNMLANVLRAPMSFFDTNPKGRVVNRFAKDVDYVDRAIPMTFAALMRLSFSVVGTIFVISYNSPIFIVVILPLTVVYFFLQKIYVKSSRQLRRLDSTTRSPIYSHFSETLSGVSTIRAYKLETRFSKENEFRIDTNQICNMSNITTNRWLSIRLEMLGNIIILFAALFAVLGRGTLDPGMVGLSLTYASQVTQTFNMLIRQTSQIENYMVSVERINEYQDQLEQEAPFFMPEQDPDKSWPQYGHVKFNDYQMRYRPGLDLVLKGINCEIQRSEKVGIVGRTGAGKSSLTMALFRIIEAAGGSIVIDGVNIAQMGLGFLRSRLTIIPQDPVLFSGNLRFNLDPFEEHSDSNLWKALENAHLSAFVSTLPTGLEHEISEGGSNLSVGQKQLVCLARALLRKTKILILDEATAAVDLDTDDLIQTTIRKEFADCTVLTIAHRLNTIMDSNRVIVLSHGDIVEFDSPSNLLSDEKTIFYGMAKDAGLIEKTD
jgi:ATP-binding cassette subfamily C (CFTR/MRP) protein 1